MVNLTDLETKARAADAMDVYDPGTDFDYQMATRPEQILKLIAVVKAAAKWKRAGTHPCGEPGCGCTECGLWAALAALGDEP